MCHISCVIFAAKYLSKEEIEGKKVIEVGSYDLNGSVRSLIQHWNPRAYVGVDLQKGPGVDIVCDAEDLVDRFGKESFDVAISTELLEHVKDWKRVVSNLKNVCAPNGIVLITTRSYGYGVHSSPRDFWRYQLEDMKEIFSDCNILVLESDLEAPGVFMKAKKPAEFSERDLSEHRLYSIVTNKRVTELSERDLHSFNFAILGLRCRLKLLMFRAGRYLHWAI